MKILKLSFKNINNLKGVHEIDFRSAPLSHAGIFAIVGPTGSGKSTLLDVITLALFNRIPRFSKAISKSEIGSLGSVITHHTTDAEASITYSIKGNIYTSKWNIAKARTGNLKDYEMFLYDAGGTPLDLKKSEVPGKNEEIIGLKYDQFIKSIILSQGEFAKFLKADKNERGQLLENITGTSIYRKLGVATYQKLKENKDLLDKEKAIIGEVNILSDEERKSLSTSLTNLEKDKITLDKDHKALNEQKTIKQEIQNSTKELAVKKIESNEVVKKLAEYAPILATLVMHDKMSPLREDYTNYKIAENNAILSSKHLEDYTKNYKQAEVDLKIVINAMSQLCKQDVDKDNFKAVMSKFEKAINELDNDLKHLKQKGQEERSLINEKKEKYTVEISSKATPLQAIEILNAHQKELTDFLKKNKITVTTSPVEIRAELSTQREQVALLKDLTHSYEHIATLEKKIALESKKLSKLDDRNKEIKPLLKKDKDHLTTLSDKLELLAKRRQDQLKIASLEDYRKELKKEEPCPLCGSLDHPYTAHLVSSEISSIEKDIQKTKKQFDDKKTSIEKLNHEISSINTARNISKESNQELASNVKEEIAKADLISKKYIGKEKINPKNVLTVHTEEKKQLQLTEDCVTSLEELAINKDLLKSYERIAQILKDYNAKQQQRREIYDGDDPIEYSNKLQDTFVTAYTSLEKSKTAIEKETKDLEGAKNIFENLKRKLSPKVTALGLKNISEISDYILDQQRVEKIQSDKDALSQFQTKNTTEITTLRKKISDLNSKDKEPKITLEAVIEKLQEQEEIQNQIGQSIGETKSQLKRDDEDKEKVKAKEGKIEKLTKVVEKWSLMNNLIGDATGNKFANFSQGLTLQNLLVYTNKRLINLTDRYLIDKPSTDGTLNVIDQYQGNTQRSVSTLSGGETFLISLALALSLSDMASKNVALDCLFIDEGFGTLDQDTLDVAMNTLEKLQSESQKTVGVISHVDALKERINVQIVLEKDPQGYSKISIDS